MANIRTLDLTSAAFLVAGMLDYVSQCLTKKAMQTRRPLALARSTILLSASHF
jgi:hypothetical protein